MGRSEKYSTTFSFVVRETLFSICEGAGNSTRFKSSELPKVLNPETTASNPTVARLKIRVCDYV